MLLRLTTRTRLLLMALTAFVILPACATHDCPSVDPVGSFSSDREIVKVKVNPRSGEISVDDSVATIYLPKEKEFFDKRRQVQVQWLVRGLPRGWKLYIVSAEGSRDDVFDMPEIYDPRGPRYEEQDEAEKESAAATQQRPKPSQTAVGAFIVEGPDNSVLSGTVQRFPKEQRRGKVDMSRTESEERFEGDKKLITRYWSYDLVLVNRRGKEVGRLDPDVRVLMYP